MRPKLKPDKSEIGQPPVSPISTGVEEVEEIIAAPDATTWHESPEDELTAPVMLPSQETLAVRLAPINLIERLEEYQTDENLAYILIGLFIGAIFGIICNWATSAPFQMSRPSIVLILLLIILAIGTGIWLYRIHKRKKSVKDKLRTP